MTRAWLHDLFDEVYVIVMDNRIKRVDAFFRSLQMHAPTYFRAVSKYDVTREQFLQEGFLTEKYYDSLNMGRICCHYSHCQVLKRFLANPEATSAIIFEDDNHPLNGTDAATVKYRMQAIMKNIPNNWEFLNFSRCWDHCDTNKEINEDMVRTYRALCRNAYAVSRAGAKKILEHTVPMKDIPGDNSIMRLTRKKNVMLRSYASTENLFAQNRETLTSELENNSTIHACTPRRRSSRTCHISDAPIEK